MLSLLSGRRTMGVHIRAPTAAVSSNETTVLYTSRARCVRACVCGPCCCRRLRRNELNVLYILFVHTHPLLVRINFLTQTHTSAARLIPNARALGHIAARIATIYTCPYSLPPPPHPTRERLQNRPGQAKRASVCVWASIFISGSPTTNGL